MGRGKIPLTLIKNESSRHAAFKKRKKGLLKKVYELTVLCEVNACMIIFVPPLHRSPGGLEIWPNRDEAMEVITRYRDLPQYEQEQGKMNNLSFLQQQNINLDKEFKKKWIQNRLLETENVYPSWDPRLDNYTVEELQDLVSFVNSKMSEVLDQIQSRENNIQSMDGNQPLPEASNNESLQQNNFSSCTHQGLCPDIEACINRLFEEQFP
eukprot:Gb_33168 [translate_table: standard]